MHASLRTGALLAAASLLLAVAPTARAEDAFGIPVYPGARTDKLSEGYCRRVDAALKTVRCYRTSDDFAKVLAFYEKQGLGYMPFWESMPKEMKDNLIRGKKKVMEWCRKPKDAGCEMMMPAVRIVSPWSDNLNLSPTTPPEQYPGKDVLIFIRADSK